MSELELNREYITRLAEEIKELKAANKALKEEIKDIVHQGLLWHEKYVALEESMDELLEAYHNLEYPHYCKLSKVIQKAEAIKKKEETK